ncbi:MAG: monooxygenase [Pseudomonadota bacterium]
MIVTLVEFHLPQAITLEEATRKFEVNKSSYKGFDGLLRKTYLVSEDGKTVAGLYFWNSRAAAEKMYNSEWRERVPKLYGVEPKLTWYESPLSVENEPIKAA